MAIIEIKNLTKIYKRSHLGKVTKTTGVANLNLTVNRGEIFGLLGLNGSGKTTTIKLLLSLLFPTEGEIIINRMPIPDIRARESMGYLPEIPAFYKFLTAGEILRFYARLSGIPEEKIDERITSSLDLVKMLRHRHRRLSEFSKGMLQRIGIAQAILHDPSLLLFDELVTGIDPIGLKDMRQLILDLNKNGKTILFSSHSISEVEKICHRVGIIVQGRLARLVEQKEWKDKEGKLEQIFIETVEPSLLEAGGIS